MLEFMNAFFNFVFANLFHYYFSVFLLANYSFFFRIKEGIDIASD